MFRPPNLVAYFLSTNQKIKYRLRALKLGYSLAELRKLFEGKMIIAKGDLKRIADCLHETYDELVRKRM